MRGALVASSQAVAARLVRRKRGPPPPALAAAAMAFVLGFAARADAYRPFDGTDAAVTEVGDCELELGPVNWLFQGRSQFLVAPAAIVNLGVLPRVELVVDAQNYVGIDVPVGEPRDQVINTDVLLKGVLVPGVLQGVGGGPSVALEVGALTPGFRGQEAFGASADAVVSGRWRDLTVHVDSWFQLTRGELHPDWYEGVILEADLGAPVRPVGELYVEHELVANVTAWSALLGAIWRVRGDLAADVGVRGARVGGEGAAEVRLGLTWTLGVWKPPERTRP
jgi:hypothetical protein